MIWGPLWEAMAPHSSTLAWKIPWMEEPGGLQSMGSLRVRHDWATSLSLFTFMHWRRKWQPTPVFLPGESQGGAWWAAVYEVTQSPTWLNRLSSSNRHFKNFLCFSLVLSSFPIIYLGLVFFLLGVCRSSSVYCLLPFFIWKILFKSTFLSFSVFLELFLHVFDL